MDISGTLRLVELPSVELLPPAKGLSLPVSPELVIITGRGEPVD